MVFNQIFPLQRGILRFLYDYGSCFNLREVKCYEENFVVTQTNIFKMMEIVIYGTFPTIKMWNRKKLLIKMYL